MGTPGLGRIAAGREKLLGVVVAGWVVLGTVLGGCGSPEAGTGEADASREDAGADSAAGDVGGDDAGAPLDAAADAAWMDAPLDAAADAAWMDAPLDAAADAAWMDAPLDAAADAAWMDAPLDAAADAAWMDAPLDAAADAAPVDATLADGGVAVVDGGEWDSAVADGGTPCGDPEVVARYATCTAARDEASCTAAGGSWSIFGLRDYPACLCPTGQEACACDSSDDCLSDCVAPFPPGSRGWSCTGVTEGTCSDVNFTIGCMCWLFAPGRVLGACFD